MRCDRRQLQLAEVGQYLRSDDMILGVSRVLFDTVLRVGGVLLHKAGKGHIQICCNLAELFSLPCLRFSFGFEATLLGLLSGTCPVGVAIDNSPGTCLFFLVTSWENQVVRLVEFPAVSVFLVSWEPGLET